VVIISDRQSKPQGGTKMSPSHISPTNERCIGIRELLSRVGDKWSVLLISILSEGPKRFSEIKRMIEGISQRMLTLTLRGLERDGLVTRTVYPTIPPRVDYELTSLGKTLQEPVCALAAWANDNYPEIKKSRDTYDKTHIREQELDKVADE
jgi:DNA-binding HxlR family transcriptional regulator